MYPSPRKGLEMGYKSTRIPVLEVFTRNPGTPMSVEHISGETGLDHIQIQGAVRGLIKDGSPIRVDIKARLWTYEPDKAKDGPKVPEKGSLMEVVGVTRAGTILVTDEYGTVYRAMHMDL